MNVLARCTHWQGVHTGKVYTPLLDLFVVEVHLLATCTHCYWICFVVDVYVQPRCMYRQGIRTGKVYVQPWCMYRQGVRTGKMYVLARCMYWQDVPTGKVYAPQLDLFLLNVYVLARCIHCCWISFLLMCTY